MSSFADLYKKLQKPRPLKLTRKDRKKAEDKEYDKNSKIARERDGHHCRICGRDYLLSTHHITPRSLLRRSPKKHAVENLLTVCWLTDDSCHKAIDDAVIKVYPNTDDGANGPCTVEKWSDTEKGYVLVTADA